VRFFTDACVPYPIVEAIRKLGWDVETAYEAGLAHKVVEDDLVRHATTNNRIFLTVDDLRSEHGERVSRELREKGGKVLKVRGGPAQNEYRALGRILFHYPDWEPFLKAGDGVAVIGDLKNPCRVYAPDEYHHRFHPLDAKQFDDYLAKRRQKRMPSKRKGRPASPDQDQMPIG